MSAFYFIIESVYSLLGVSGPVNAGDFWGFTSVVVVLLISLKIFLNKAPLQKKIVLEQKVEIPLPEQKKVVEPTGPSWASRLKKGLERSRVDVWGKIFNRKNLSGDAIEEIEEILYGADLGPAMVTDLVSKLEKELSGKELTSTEFKKFIFDFLREKMGTIQKGVDSSLYQFTPNENKKGPKVIMVVGVNGAGKTTTIGKLATKLTRQGAKVVVGACDTFRAAAVDQLQVWCERANAEMIRANDGSNPSGVGYQALERAIAVGADYCILDTAGRLHTSDNLMQELAKSKSVLSKLDPTAPHQTLLVIDAITGQNALRQAVEFHKSLNLTGLIFTKCDGSSKAGSAISIVDTLKTPITFIGVGESVEDLDLFDLDDYLSALLDFDGRAALV